MDRGARRAPVHGVAESDTTERLSQPPHVPGSELSPLCLLLDASHSEALASVVPSLCQWLGNWRESADLLFW